MQKDLKIHFFTIVLNGMPFIEKHIETFSKISPDWHWHIIEGVAALKKILHGQLQMAAELKIPSIKMGFQLMARQNT